MAQGSTYQQGTVTVGTSATLIASPDAGTGGIYITNTGAVTVTLGGSSVTTSGANAGPTLAANQSLIFPTSAGPTSLYGIVASGTTTVAFAFSPVY